MIAIDTNLLVYAHRAAVPEHRAAQAAIERAAQNGRGWGIPAQVVAEWWAVVTHPQCAGRPSSAGEAAAFLHGLRDSANMNIWSTSADFGFRFAELAGKMDVSGSRVFDLQIGLCALESGARELWTHDRRFTAPAGLRVVDPLA